MMKPASLGMVHSGAQAAGLRNAQGFWLASGQGANLFIVSAVHASPKAVFGRLLKLDAEALP